MATLATEEEVSTRLGRALTDSEVVRVAALLVDASAAVRGYTGQQFDTTSTTARLRVRNGIVMLPQRPVTAVASVDDVDGNEVAFTWDGDDRVRLDAVVLNAWEINERRYGLSSVDVAYTHGYASTPDDIVAVVCQIVGRALGRTPDAAGVTQESIEGYSYTIGAAAGAGPLGLLADERAVLDRYRRVGASARFG